MSTNEPDHLEFRGKDLKECEDFISAVNKQARAQGKFRDDQWIADLVGASMAGDALTWWSSLDDQTQESWKLLRKAMLSRYRLHFTGKSATEAEDFVHWVRQRALDAGKFNDPRWTAELASGCFVGSALRWHTSLDPGIQGDWVSLQKAIFLQYSESSEEGSSLSIVPTAASAAASPSLSKPRTRGRIRIQKENDPAVWYLSKGFSKFPDRLGQIIATPHLAEAIEVEYKSLPPTEEPQTLFIPNNQIPDCDVLGIKWYYADLTHNNRFLRLCGVNSSTQTGSPGPSYAGPLLATPWKISRSANAQGTLSLEVISGSGSRLLPSTTQSAYWVGDFWFRGVRVVGDIDVELFFEPV